MGTKYLATLGIGIGILLLAGAFILYQEGERDVNDVAITPTPNGATPTPNGATPTPPDRNVTIEQPRANATVDLPVVISGQARVFEQTVQVRIRDEDGSILAERFTTTDAPDVGEFGPYSVELHYPHPQGQTGTVEAFQYSAQDGSEIDLVSVPVRFREVDALTVRAYFSNRQEDPDFDRCEVVYATERRIPRTQAVGRAALEQLLMGPTNDEADTGFVTSIPLGVSLRDLDIEDGVARADFSIELDDVAGSCAVLAARSQISQTLLQFNTVREVEILIEGRADDVLEP